MAHGHSHFICNSTADCPTFAKFRMMIQNPTVSMVECHKSQKFKMVDDCHLENRYINIFWRKII